jgi:two-component sensor histidine kinase
MWQRLGDALLHLAVRATSAHLSRASTRIVERWRTALQAQVPRYGRVADLSAWGTQGLDGLVAVARAWSPAERTAARAAVVQAAHAVAGEQLQQGFSLAEILQALALFRLVVLGEIQRLLRRRLWLAFPWDVMHAADRINEAIDLEMLAIGQAYLEEREEVIRRREQELVASNEQLRTLLREMHHRIKNNLQTLADLLYLAEREAASPEAARSLRDSLARVKSIATVHRLLSLDHIEKAELRSLAEAIASGVCRDLGRAGTHIDVQVDGPPLLLPSKQATSLALVLGELLTNAIAHAFPGRARGRVDVTLAEEDGQVIVRVQDDGVGLPPDLDPSQVENLGLSIVRTLVSRDLHGTLAMLTREGTIAEVRFRR